MEREGEREGESGERGRYIHRLEGTKVHVSVYHLIEVCTRHGMTFLNILQTYNTCVAMTSTNSQNTVTYVNTCVHV